MKAIVRFKVSGSMLLLAALLAGCNKQQESQGGAASANAVPPGGGATMMGPGMHAGPAPSGSSNGGPMMPMQNGMMPGAMLDQMRTSCPMLITDTLVQVDDTDKGVALSFTTQKGDVAELRARVAHLAQMYQMHHGQGSGMMWHQMAGPGMRGEKGMAMTSGNAGHMGMGMGPGGGRMGTNNGMMAAMPAVTVAVSDLPSGSKLVLTPDDPAELSTVRAQARQHQEHLQSGQCWMQQGASSDPSTKAP